MKNKVLIITHTKDNNCIETVSKSIKDKGGIAVRLDVDRYPLDYCFSSLFNNGEREILLKEKNGTVHNLTTEFSGLWNRRFYNLAECLKDVVEKKYLDGCVGEAQVTLTGVLSHLEHEMITLNSYSETRKASIKEMQLRIAEECGLRIPRTCISNDFEQVEKFIKSCTDGAVVKMQHGFRTYADGEEQVMFTNTVGEDDFDELKTQLSLCPMQFQEKIEKKLELRITVIGKRLFAAALDSQATAKGKIDWRKVGAETVGDWVPYEIPDDLKNKMLDFHEFCNLNYGASDVILTPEGDYVFLETNPGGEFFWLDMEMDYEISDEIASLLLGHVSGVPHSTMVFSDLEKMV